MKITLKENVNTKSLVLQHNILTQAITLMSGREEALETEKDIYLMIALVNAIIEEDLIQECNNDGRDLNNIVALEIEPFFLNLIEKESQYETMFNNVKRIFSDYYQKLYEKQHSFMGILDALLTSIEAMGIEDKKEVLNGTAKIAEQAYRDRTEKLQEQLTKITDNLKNNVINQTKEEEIKE